MSFLCGMRAAIEARRDIYHGFCEKILYGDFSAVL